MNLDNNIFLGEHFYSIQGEGVSNGVPSYFMRLANCNFACGGLNGSKLKSGVATWHCDSEAIWSKPQEILIEDILKIWVDLGILTDIVLGNVHIVWTGGEPLIKNNISQIINFMKYFKKYLKLNHPVLYFQYNVFLEVETNGSQKLPPAEDIYFNQINCSPKLKNSGNPAKIRINEEALKIINNHKNSWFKIVISSEEDIQEFFKEFIIPFNLDSNKIILMPAMTNQNEYFEKTKMVYEFAKQYKIRAVSRNHIACWNKTVGV